MHDRSIPVVVCINIEKGPDPHVTRVKAAFLLASKPIPLGIPGTGEASLLPEGLFLKPPEHSEHCPVADIDEALFGPTEARRPLEDGFLIPYNAMLNVSIFRPLKVGIKYVLVSYLDRRGEKRELFFCPLSGRLIPRSLADLWAQEIAKKVFSSKI